jgi:hypothetical protein
VTTATFPRSRWPSGRPALDFVLLLDCGFFAAID